MTEFLNLVASEPDIARVPVMIDSSKWEVIEAGLKCVQGKPIVNSISMKEGEDGLPAPRAALPGLWRRRRRHGLRREGPGRHRRRARSRSARGPTGILTEEVGFPPEDIVFDPNIFAVATGIEEHNNYGVDFIEATRRDHRDAAARACLGRRVEPLLLVPRQRAGARGDARGVPLPCDPGRHGHGHRQCRPARGLRHHRARAARGLRGRGAEPPRRRDRAAAGARRALQGRPPGARRASATSPGASGRSRSGSSMRWSTASPSSSRPTPRRRGSRPSGRCT